jgi:hypothetical protein
LVGGELDVQGNDEGVWGIGGLQVGEFAGGELGERSDGSLHALRFSTSRQRARNWPAWG